MCVCLVLMMTFQLQTNKIYLCTSAKADHAESCRPEVLTAYLMKLHAQLSQVKQQQIDTSGRNPYWYFSLVIGLL